MKFRPTIIVAAVAIAAALALSLAAGASTTPQAVTPQPRPAPVLSEKQLFASIFATNFAAGNPTPGIVIHVPKGYQALIPGSVGTAKNLSKPALQVNGECSTFDFTVTSPGQSDTTESESILKNVAGEYEIFLGVTADRCWDMKAGLSSEPMPLTAIDQQRAIAKASARASEDLSNQIDSFNDHLSEGSNPRFTVRRLNDSQLVGPVTAICRTFTVNIEGPVTFRNGIWSSSSSTRDYYVLSRISSAGHTEYAFFIDQSSPGFPGFCG